MKSIDFTTTEEKSQQRSNDYQRESNDERISIHLYQEMSDIISDNNSIDKKNTLDD